MGGLLSSGLTIVIIVAVVLVVAILTVINAYSRRYVKVGPNQALIVYGRGKQPDIRVGGGVFVLPIFERAETFSLELMSFDVAPQQNMYTNQGVSVRVEAVTQLKVRNDRDSILTASEQFLSKSWDERQGLIRLVMEGHLRGIVGQLTIEQIVKEPEMVSEKMRSTSSADLAKMGLEVVSFTIKEVRDENDYISNMGRPEIERIKKEANIAAALAARDTQIQQANASREAAVAKAEADQTRVAAETASQAKQAESQRDLALKRAEYDAEVKKQQVVADKASDLQAQIVQQQIVAETARAQEIDKTAQIKVQEAEAQRRQVELEATVVKAADAEKQRIETQASAERQRITLEAEGRAAALRAQAAAEGEAAKVRGAADAEAARLRGMAEADVIRAKGEAEAEAMRVKAAAYQEYNQAAVLDKVVSNLPEIVRAIAEPLSKVDKISIVSTGGNGDGNLGASRITGDVVAMLAQVPAVLQAVTGMRMDELMARVPGLRTVDGTTAPANGANGTNGATPSATPNTTNPSSESSAADASATTNGDTSNGTPGTSSDPSGTTSPVGVAAGAGATGGTSATPGGANTGPRRQRSR
ncbi:MAG TPA: SPFH domain-containing protein [Ktedonobacterales bacterium]|nr:SPFH domain-containing protein [Ktedonobacterales bacterium]